MVNYKNGKIYKIISDKTDKFYVGSTAQLYLSTRMATHKCKHNVCMSKNIGYDLNECSIIYNMESANIIKEYMFYLIMCKKYTSDVFIEFLTYVFHFDGCDSTYFVNYCLLKLISILK